MVAPLAYLKTIFASATARFRKSTRTRTRETAAYRSSVNRGSGPGVFPLAVVMWRPFGARSLDGRRRGGATPKAVTWNRASEHARRRHRPPAQLHFADDVF